MRSNIFFLFSAFSLLSLKTEAQQNTDASGGEASGSGGSISYSIGQIDFSSSSGSGGSLSEGVQQPYVISITTGISQTGIQLNCSVYPNPTVSTLTLFTDQTELNGMSYVLTDLQGKQISTGTISENRTLVSMEALNSAIYFVTVKQEGKEVKTFKVIKN